MKIVKTGITQLSSSVRFHPEVFPSHWEGACGYCGEELKVSGFTKQLTENLLCDREFGVGDTSPR
ncbi:MAG: hypothetical protein HEQ35_04040 [Gloeotrichia echinulata IR180]|nr:hypothetical protein [Gloeotrichia echinulata DEX184]